MFSVQIRDQTLCSTGIIFIYRRSGVRSDINKGICRISYRDQHSRHQGERKDLFTVFNTIICKDEQECNCGKHAFECEQIS